MNRGVKKQLRDLGVSVYIDDKGRLKIGCKTGVSANRVKADPVFARTRESAAEFGRAGRMSGRVTHLFKPWSGGGGPHLSARLTRTLVSVIRSDTRNDRGHRCVADGDLRLLEGFECNATHQPPGLEKLRCRLLRSAKGDQVLLKTDPFAADLFLTREVKEATHCKVGLIVAAVPDAPQGRSRLYKTSTRSLLAGEPLVPSMQLVADIVPVETAMVFIAALAINFYRFSNERSLPYDQGKQDLLRLVKVFSA